ncbi:sulfotransferase 1E1-like [Watersipora subatra]|uniref:sulfotransferase 1E1-like n=1 Tax=Watersipora subatra TaxID=2589382 RepID=UPI00355AE644
MEVPPHPRGSSVTNLYVSSEDGSVKIPAMVVDEGAFGEIYQALKDYKWHEEDFLLASYPKNGTNFLWEIMTMLLRGTSEYIKDFKALCMVDLFPVTKLDTDKLFASPRVLNTHYRFEALPDEFKNRKTVLILRNPKDVCLSYFHMEAKMWGMVGTSLGSTQALTLHDYIKIFLFGKDVPFGNFFQYLEYMWAQRDNPNIHVLFYEDLIMDPVGEIQKLNEFMKTKRSPELIQQIADATSFDKMQQGKSGQGHDNKALLDILKTDENTLKGTLKLMFRKGKIGDWKNSFTVADNELFDAFLKQWEGGKDIPFRFD